MRVHLLAVGTRMPDWVQHGFDDYVRRLPNGWLQLKEIPLGKRTASSGADKARRLEGERLLAAIPKRSLVVALQCAPKSWSTAQLLSRVEAWMHDGRDIALLVGGPDGLSSECLQRAEQQWSLSALTLPHGMVRIMVAEQLYRCWATMNNHPYHRA